MLRRLFKAAAAKADTVTVVYPADPSGRGSCAAGVIIDGAVYRLEGEPDRTRPASIWAVTASVRLADTRLPVEGSVSNAQTTEIRSRVIP